MDVGLEAQNPNFERGLRPEPKVRTRPRCGSRAWPTRHLGSGTAAGRTHPRGRLARICRRRHSAAAPCTRVGMRGAGRRCTLRASEVPREKPGRKSGELKVRGANCVKMPHQCVVLLLDWHLGRLRGYTCSRIEGERIGCRTVRYQRP